MRLIDISGQRFGKLLVLSRNKDAPGQTRWNCLCDCGSETVKKGILLKKGITKSCGCIVKTHGHSSGGSRTKTYMVWDSMRSRCNNPSHHAWENYGGRGISVCERWESFSAFVDDMGEKPDGMSLDRINNNLGYSKDNCRWADSVTQNRNSRNNVIVEWMGHKKTIAEWAQLIGWPHDVIGYRMRKGNSGDDLFRPRRRESYSSDFAKLERVKALLLGT